MNYSKNQTYGRKTIKGHRNEIIKRLLMSWVTCFVIGLLIGGLIGWTIASLDNMKVAEPDKPVKITSIGTRNEPIIIPEPIVTVEPKIISLGEYKLTAYCACEKCCGKSDGITASGVKAVQGVTVAADTRIHPFGTKLIIDGLGEYTVQDKGSAIKGNKIDIYFDSHQDALEFGVQYKEIFRKEGEIK